MHQVEFSWLTHRIFFTVLQIAVLVYGQNYELYTSCGNSVNVGDTCALTCETKSVADTDIIWYNGTTAISAARSNCTVTTPSLPDYTSDCPTATSYRLSFINADYCRDGVLWSCDFDFGGKQSNATTPKFTVTVPLREVRISWRSSYTSITCDAVANPPPSITLYLENGTEVMSVPSSDANESCGGWTISLTYNLTDAAFQFREFYCQSVSGSFSLNSTLLPGKIEPTTRTETTPSSASSFETLEPSPSSSPPASPPASPTSSTNETVNPGNIILPAVLGSIGGAVLILLIAVGVISVRRRKKSKQVNSNGEQNNTFHSADTEIRAEGRRKTNSPSHPHQYEDRL